MHDIRFSPPPRNQDPQTKSVAASEVAPKEAGKSGWKNFAIALAVLAVMALIVALGWYLWNLKPKVNALTNAVNSNKVSESYYAVFLSNGQVYFGKMEKNDSEIILKNVFYLQAEKTDKTNSSEAKLVRLSDAAHGPKDEIFINRQQIVFYEELRQDSKIAQSIEQVMKK